MLKINYSSKCVWKSTFSNGNSLILGYLWNINDLEKITAYPNEAIHDDCVVAFTGGYEKIANEKQPKRVDVDKWYFHITL